MKHSVLSESELSANGTKKQYDIFRNYHKTKRLTGDVHTHTYFETVLITEGELYYRFSDREPIRLSAGDVIFVPANVIHQTRQLSSSAMRSVVVKFSPMFLYPMESTQSDLDCLVMPPIFCEDFYVFRAETARARELSEIMLAALQEVEQERLGFELALRGRLTTLYTTLLRCCSSVVPTQTTATDAESASGSSREFYQIMVYLRENFQYNISMQEVAEVFGMSYYHFSRFFKKLTSKKFNEYLLELRLNSAQKKLLEEGKSVSEVALECGFEYVSYFIQKFKEKNGMTPRDFQRKYRGSGSGQALADPADGELLASGEGASDSAKDADRAKKRDEKNPSADV